jgi:hypothetical protein
MTTFLSDVHAPEIGLAVRSFWQTLGRVAEVREMRDDERSRFAAREAIELFVQIEWSHGGFDEAPLSQMDWIKVVA